MKEYLKKFLAWLVSFLRSDAETVLGSINARAAKAVATAYLESKRDQALAAVRDKIARCAADGRNALVVELKDLDQKAADLLRASGFTVNVKEDTHEWEVLW